MFNFESRSRVLTRSSIGVLIAFVAGCGGGKDPILGTGGNPVLEPAVLAVSPVANATAVPINSITLTAAFNKAMNPATLTATSFTLACPGYVPATTPVVTYLAVGNLATLTLPSSPSLPASSVCTATITTAATDASGNALPSKFVWTFTTGVTPDTTRPTVLLTVPANLATLVGTNVQISATFSEDMAPATIVSVATYTLTCAPACVRPSPTGTVAYTVGSRTAVFAQAPAGTLFEAGKTYTATITTAATDVAGNQLAGNQAPPPPAASNYIWTFTTGPGPAPAGNVVVAATKPVAAAIGVCPGTAVNATFSLSSGLRLDPVSVNATTFTVTGPGSTPVTAASVTLDAPTGSIATFTPLAALTNGVIYTATIKGGASGMKDLAVPANMMLADFVWTFTGGPATGACLAPIALGSASTFGNFGGLAGMTNSGTLTINNGNIGTTATGTSSITGFHDTAGDVYSETPANIGAVNGRIYTCTNSTTGPTAAGVNAASCAIATQARLDAQAAYLALVGLPAGANPGGNLAGLTLAPGVYTAPAGSLLIQGGADLTLDAQGDANAVWVFQMATTLTVGGPGASAPRSIILAGGAQAKNVFWQVGTAATINAAGGGTMVGTIITQTGATFSTAGNVAIVTLNGRALSLGASITLVDTVINVPAP